MKPCPNLDCEAWYSGISPIGCRKCQQSNAWLKFLGLCWRCRKPHTEPGTRCEECKKKAVAGIRKVRCERRMNGRCLDCNAPALKGQVRCRVHKVADARRHRRGVQNGQDRVGIEEG